MRIGAAIYQHTDGRWEARYRKGRKPDGTFIYGSVYGKTYEEAEQKRAELLRNLAVQAENCISEEAVLISGINKGIRDFYAVVPRGRTSFPEPLTDEEVNELVSVIGSCYPGLRLAICLSLYMGIASEELATLTWSDIDCDAGTLLISHVMVDAKHMLGTVVPCDKRMLPIPKIINNFVDLSAAVQKEKDSYILTARGGRIKALRSEKLLWAKALTAYDYNKKITPEILRATFIRRSFEKGINFETVSYFTGLTVPVLRTKYGHLAKANPSLLDSVYDFAESSAVATAKQMNLLILGAGGQGQVVRETAEAIGVFEHIAFLDDDTTLPGVLDSLGNCQRYRNDYPMAFVTIGNNELRRKLINHLQMAGFIVPVLKHPTATISPAVEAGAGTIFEAKNIVNPAVKIGKGVILSSASIVEHGAVIHDYSHVEAGTIIRKGMIIPAGMRVNNLNLNELNSAQNAG